MIMDDKYVELLVSKCTNLENSKCLFINYNKEIKDFVLKIVSYAKSIGVSDIYLDEEDIHYTHDLLAKLSLEEIKTCDYFNKKIWDTYAKKGASFLIIETEVPHVMDDIDPEKIGLMGKLKRETKPLYRELQRRCKLAWCIAAYPGKEWANDVFKNDSNSYEKLKNYIFKTCMLDKDDPCLEWDKFINRNTEVMNKLNSLKLKKLHYTNSLGTDLEIYLPSGYLYAGGKDELCIVNMPSYEVFTSPVWNKTKGIVYSSKPLMYNGSLIDNFWIKFENGKVIDYDARVGLDVLKEIIETDEYSCYLGEAALVEKNSPIAFLGFNFGTTLIDENASCHLALGAGFSECIIGGLDMSAKELKEHGINDSKQHVDFMIGTDDLNITGETIDGEQIVIFENGKFSSLIVD